MKAMILAAGFGTRLFPLTIDRTKPAIPFLNKPLVGYVAEYVAKYGFKDIIVNLHHQPESVKKALGDGTDYGVKIHYTLEQPEILGTAGALDNARAMLEDETFIVINGKIITDIDISAALETHRRTGAIATMVLKENAKRERFTEVLSNDGFITCFGDFPAQNPTSETQTPLMFTGIQILEPAVFDYIPRGIYSDIVPTFYNPAIKKGEKIAAHTASGNWFELSTIQRYLDISLAMMKDGKNVVDGANCRLSSGATVQNSVLWDNVTIGENAELNRTIVGDGVEIKPNAVYENAAIVRAEMLVGVEIPPKAMEGYIEDNNFVVPLAQ